MFTENLLDTGGCAGRGWNEIAANVAASELSVSFFPAGSSSEAGAPLSDDLPPLWAGAVDSWGFQT
jgi:hypothetical protein